MPRYEFSDGSSNKFWEIKLTGTSFTTTFGRIGTSGQSSEKDYGTDEKAQKEYDKLVAEKVKKGYIAVGGGAKAAAAKAAPAKAAPAKAAPAKAAPAKPAAAKPAAGKKKPVFDDEGDDEDEAPKPKVAAKAAAKPAAKGKGGARYFELVEGSSSKFWEVTLAGSAVTTRYGKIGTDGQKTTKDYDSDAKAKTEADKLVAEKTKKGYSEK